MDPADVIDLKDVAVTALEESSQQETEDAWHDGMLLPLKYVKG